MIINDEHKFIFIHVPKIAGESIKAALSSWPMRYSERIPHHLPAKGIQKAFPEKWKSYYKFAFVRNPWSWLVSLYHFKLHRDIPDVWLRPIILESTFAEFIKKLTNPKLLLPPYWRIERAFRQQVFANFGTYVDSMLEEGDVPFNKSHLDFYLTDLDDKLPDYIGKIDTLQEDLNHVCDSIGIDPVQLIHKNASPHKHHSSYYDDETKDIVAKIFAKDIKHFGWIFEEADK